MKILAITADIDPNNLGGAEWHFVEVAKRIHPKTLQISYPHITNLYGLLFILFALPPYILECLNSKPDVLWAKQEFPQGVVAGILKRIFNTPIYLTCQSAIIHKDELVIKGPFPSWLKNWLSDQAAPLVSFAFSQADVVGSVSNYSAENAQKMGARKTVIVPNGIDLEIFSYRPPKISKVLKIITTSSLIPRNGVDTLIKGCALLKNKNWRLKIAGDGPERSNYEKLTESLGVSNQVAFLGRVPSKKIPNLLQKSDVFVRLSRAEGFGSSFLEAMATGLIVIGTPVGGIVDFLENDKTGILIPPDRPEKLAGVLRDIQRHPTRFIKMTQNVRKKIETAYTWDNIAEKVYDQMRRLYQHR